MFNNMLVNSDANEVELVWLVYKLRLPIMIKKKKPTTIIPSEALFYIFGSGFVEKGTSQKFGEHIV